MPPGYMSGHSAPLGPTLPQAAARVSAGRSPGRSQDRQGQQARILRRQRHGSSSEGRDRPDRRTHTDRRGSRSREAEQIVEHDRVQRRTGSFQTRRRAMQWPPLSVGLIPRGPIVCGHGRHHRAGVLWRMTIQFWRIDCNRRHDSIASESGASGAWVEKPMTNRPCCAKPLATSGKHGEAGSASRCSGKLSHDYGQQCRC